MINYKTFILLEGYETNTYLVWDTETLEAILIDPAAPDKELKETIQNMNLKLKKIINTHGHGDHIGGNEYFHKAFDVPICIHKYDAEMLGNSQLNLSYFMHKNIESPSSSEHIDDSDEFYLGEFKLKVYHTPGHTKGGIIVYIKPFLFTGDTIFHLDIGRTDLPGGSIKELVESIKTKVFTLPDETIILPGHGEASTIKKEKEENPYLN